MLKLFRSYRVTALALLGLVLVFVLGIAVVIWIGDADMRARLRALREAEEPLSLADLARPAIPDDTNAATFLREASAEIRAASTMLTPILLLDEDTTLTEDHIKLRHATFAQLPNLFPLLQKAAACPDYDSRLNYTLSTDAFISAYLPPMQDNRNVFVVLDQRAKMQVADGRQEEALETVLVMLRLSRHMDRDPMQIGWLVACFTRAISVEAANHVLRAGPISAKGRAELDAELALADSTAGFVHALKTERAFKLDSDRAYRNSLHTAFVGGDQVYFLDLVELQISLAPKTYAEAQKAIDEFVAANASFRYVLSGHSAIAITKLHEAYSRTLARVRCLRVLNALQARPQADSAAVKLSDLGLPAGATIDPYNGLPILLRKTNGQWVIYCVGTNLIDDGGDLPEGKDIGLGPTKK
jgi:hypothetical protein